MAAALDPAVEAGSIHLGSTSFGNITDNKGVNIGNALSSTIIGLQNNYYYSDSQANGKAEQDVRFQIMQWLCPHDFALAASSHERISNHIDPRSGQWLLQSKEFTDWQGWEQDGKRLWLVGMPGAGKSVLASIVINHLKKLRASFKDDNQPSIAFLYLSYQAPQNLIRLLGSLVKQIITDWETIPESIEKLWNEHGKGKSEATLFELSRLLAELAEKRPLFIVIDALDECQPQLREPLIKALPETTGQFSLLLTSRLLEDLSQLSMSFQQLKVSAHADDVSYFLEGRIAGNARLRQFVEQDPTLRDEIKETILSRCGEMFLLAYLHMNSIEAQDTLRQVRKSIETISDDLGSTYDDVIVRIRNQRASRRDTAIKALCWIIYARRPLTIRELLHALAIEPGHTSFDHEMQLLPNDILEFCCGLVVVDGWSSKVQLVHYTTRDYFNNKRSDPLFSGFDAEMALICTTYLSLPALVLDEYVVNGNWMSYAYDLYDDPDKYSYAELHKLYRMDQDGEPDTSESSTSGPRERPQLSFRTKLTLYPLVTYAAAYVGDHLRGSPAQSDNTVITLTLLHRLLTTRKKRRFLMRLWRELGLYRPTRILYGQYQFLEGDSDHESEDEEEEEEEDDDDDDDDDVEEDEEQYSDGAESQKSEEDDRDGASEDDAQNVSDAVDEKDDASDEDSETLASRSSRVDSDPPDKKDSVTATSPPTPPPPPEEVTPLHLAAFLGSASLCERFLAEGVEVDEKDTYDQTAMTIAVTGGHTGVAFLLLQRGANVDLTTPPGQTLLLQAARNNFEDIVEKVLAAATGTNTPKPPTNEDVRQNWWIWIWELILTYIVGAVHGMTGSRQKSSKDATSQSKKRRVVRRQRSVGEPSQAHELVPYLRLAQAAYTADTSTVETLIDSHLVNLRAQNPRLYHSLTKVALFLAVERKIVEIVRTLLEHGGNVNSRDYRRQTPLHRATDRNDMEMVKMLLAHQAQPNLEDETGQTAWGAYAHPQREAVLRLLIKAGADPNSKDNLGVNVLYGAAAGGHLHQVEFLLLCGVDPSITTNFGWAPLHWAAADGHIEVVRLLLSKGANPSPVSDTTKTPLDLARERGRDAVVRLLEQVGAKTGIEALNRRVPRTVSYEENDDTWEPAKAGDDDPRPRPVMIPRAIRGQNNSRRDMNFAR